MQELVQMLQKQMAAANAAEAAEAEKESEKGS